MNLKQLSKKQVSDSIRIEDAKDSVREQLRQALSILNGIRNSDYIPFTSPYPSSTEAKIKKSINNAITSLFDAIDAHDACYNR